MLEPVVFGITHKNLFIHTVELMDAEYIIEKIPSIEKIFALVWILSWVLAIWFYHIQFFLTGLFSLFLVLLLLGVFDRNEDTSHRPPVVFSMDKNTRSLKVQKIYENSINWDEHEVCSGYCKLPKGKINEGDMIRDCSGNIAIRHVPSNRLMGGFNFEEKR